MVELAYFFFYSCTKDGTFTLSDIHIFPILLDQINTLRTHEASTETEELLEIEHEKHKTSHLSKLLDRNYCFFKKSSKIDETRNRNPQIELTEFYMKIKKIEIKSLKNKIFQVYR